MANCVIATSGAPKSRKIRAAQMPTTPRAATLPRRLRKTAAATPLAIMSPTRIASIGRIASCGGSSVAVPTRPTRRAPPSTSRPTTQVRT